MFATAADVQTRIGRALSAEELATVELLLQSVQAEIELAIGKSQSDLSPEPPILKAIAIEAVARRGSVPNGEQSATESIGAYSYTVRYGGGGDLLTLSEELKAKRAVWGSNSGSGRAESLIHDYTETDV